MIGLAVCGMNGSGKSSTAKALSNELGLRLLDIEGYCFPPADPPLSVERKKAKSSACFGATLKQERREPGFSGDRLSGDGEGPIFENVKIIIDYITKSAELSV